MRYDVCIIGAGADGLACAAWSAMCGLKTVVVEREASPGGRCVTGEFAPGFFASTYIDEVPEIPDDIFRALHLARRGAIFACGQRPATFADHLRSAVIARVMADADRPRRRLWRSSPSSWPGEELFGRSLAECGSAELPLAPGMSDPHLIGSAAGLLAGVSGGMPAGGLGQLAKALHDAADEAGAEILLGRDVTDIRRRVGRVVSVGLADGDEIMARAVVSTLDLKRTFLSLFAWDELSKPLVERVGAFRSAPGVARLLVALDSPPPVAEPSVLRVPIVTAPTSMEMAYRAWRAGTLLERPPAVLRLVSAVDPFLAPEGAATLTITLSAIPYAPFDGGWTQEKRDILRDRALAVAEAALPGTLARVRAVKLIVPPDIEGLLGLSNGDLSGGEYSAAQMLGFRPFPEYRGTRTPVTGLYLAGPSSTLAPLATCASGVAAARAVLADRSFGRFL